MLCNDKERVCQLGTTDIGLLDHCAIYCTRKIVIGTLNTDNIIKIRSITGLVSSVRRALA